MINSFRTGPSHNTVRDYAQADWSAFKSYIHNNLLTFSPDLRTIDGIDSTIHDLTQIIHDADGFAVSSKVIKHEGLVLTPEIISLIRVCRARRRYW